MTAIMKKPTAYTGSVSYIQEKDKNTNWTITQMPLGTTLKKDFPEVEESGRLMGRERTLFKKGMKIFMKQKFIMLTALSSRFSLINLLKAMPPLH